VKSTQLLDCPSAIVRTAFNTTATPRRLCRGNPASNPPEAGCVTGQGYAFGYNGWNITGAARGPSGLSFAAMQDTAQVIQFADAEGATPEFIAASPYDINQTRGQVAARRHFDQDAFNACFVDGHVKYVKVAATMSSNSNVADNMWNALRPAAP